MGSHVANVYPTKLRLTRVAKSLSALAAIIVTLQQKRMPSRASLQCSLRASLTEGRRSLRLAISFLHLLSP